MDRFDGDDIMASALAQRPELQVGRVELEQAKILERFSRNQRRPDMTFSASGRFSQNSSVHGYKTIEASLKHLGRPDSNYRIYALDYSYPVGNRALKAKEAQSRTNVSDAELSLSAVENQIRREIKDALSDIRASMARIQASTETVAFAQLAYDKLQIRRDNGEINEFEWTLNLRRLMDAKLSQLSARIDLKKGLSRLRAAKGTIAHYYVAAVSENRFVRLRMGALEANGALLFLGTGPANDLEERQK
jgi:outer membrane protein TolC